MKKSIVLAWALFLLGSVAVAQEASISGAVGFAKKTQEEKVEEPQAVNQKITQPKIDEAAILAKTTKNTWLWDNPRYAKIAYGRLAGMQQAIEAEQQKELEKTTYATEKEKQEALKQMQSQAVVHFEDSEPDEKKRREALNKNPRAGVLDMAGNVSFLDEQKATPEFTDYARGQMEKDFYQENGLTIEEYNEAFIAQVEEQVEKRRKEDEKSDTFPPKDEKNFVTVEKVDEQNALIQRGVGAPKSVRKVQP